MKQLDLFTGKESDYVPNFTSYFSHFEAPDDLDHLLRRLNVLDAGMLYLGERMKKRPISPHYQGLCPFHKEKTPSFYLKPAQNRFVCYGCGISGGPLQLDSRLGDTVYSVIAERAKIDDLLPYLSSLSLAIAHLQQSAPQQREYLTVLKEAFQREAT